MATWASKKRILYVGTFLVIFIFIVSIPLYFYLSKPPTCTDGKQNGDETGVDCGGSCERICLDDLLDPVVHWNRAFEVVPGVYDAVALVENPNFGAGVEEIVYKFKLYDSENILILEKFGKTFIGPNEEFLVFEPALRTGERIPRRAFFEFSPDPEWKRITLPEQDIPDLSVEEKQLTNLDTKPRLDAEIINNSFFVIENVEVVAVLYDASDNAVAVSRTVLDEITQGQAEPVVFTWPDPFDVQPVRVDIIPRVNLFEL